MLRLNRKGFTLVELMIVVAIIALLVAIAIPNLLRARLNANRSAAIGMLRSLQTAMESFRAAQNAPTYPTIIGAVGGAVTTLQGALPPYVSGFTVASTVAGLEWNRSGYAFGCSGLANNYECVADPITGNVTGVDSFCVNEVGVIRVSPPVAGVPAPLGAANATTPVCVAALPTLQ